MDVRIIAPAGQAESPEANARPKVILRYPLRGAVSSHCEADKPRNLVLDWKKGTMLSDALQQTLKTGFPGVKANINISSQLIAAG
jgi:hypothetical protein